MRKILGVIAVFAVSIFVFALTCLAEPIKSAGDEDHGKSFRKLNSEIETDSAMCKAAERSILQWHPGQGIAPQVSVEVQWFKDNDFLSPKITGMGKFQPLSGIMDTFCGTSNKHRKKFSEMAKEYEFPKVLHHPAHRQPEKSGVVISAYHSPYEFHQKRFLTWTKKELGKDDFLAPAARKKNQWKGDLADPVVTDRKLITDKLLEQTFGYVALAQPDRIVFIGDNRVNPYRWMSPINEIHHREQPAWGMRLHTKPEFYAETVKVLGENRNKESNQRIVLSYEIALKIDDFRDEMQEFTLNDYLSGSSEGLTYQCYSNSVKYAAGEKNGQVSLDSLQMPMVEKFLQTRFEPSNFQLSVGINFKERDSRYRLAEFMLCSWNQQPCNYYPPKPGDLGFVPTACQELNPLIRDGGNNGAGAWWRAPVSVLNNEALTRGEKSAWTSHDPYLELKNPQLSSKVFKGEIDITRFYRQALRADFFPGQRGYWDDRWVGFEGDADEFRDPDEQHGVEWAFFIFENHGPLRVEAQVRQLNVRIVK